MAASVSHHVPKTFTSKVLRKISSVPVEVVVGHDGGPPGVVHQDVEPAVPLDGRLLERVRMRSSLASTPPVCVSRRAPS